MSKTLLIVLFAALYSLHAWPQTGSYVRVKGRITDKDTQHPLPDATVALLYAKDSSRAAAAFTDKNGLFVLTVRAGAYLLYITYLGYQQQLKPITVTTDTLTDLGTIPLQKTGVTLRMVEIVEIRAPMVVKKDTLEFNADYYKTRENAVMEELLKKLPGIEIDKEGNLKVNGEIVKRILVDGKPYFGDDPKLALRNLPADMIDKIQLIDRKSDQAQFSGASDPKTEKAVNITVKKQKKEKFLGRLAAGYGNNERFAVNGSLNRFGTSPLSFLAGGNNVNSAQEAALQIGGSGIARIWNGGINYNTDINSALKISASYYVANFNLVNERKSTRQNILPDTTYYYDQGTATVSRSTSHASDIRMEYKPDSLQSLILSTNINYLNSNETQENFYESSGDQKQLVNKGTINNSNHNASPNISGTILWGKRFKKAGRTLSASLMAGYNTSKQQQFNRSDNLFIQPDGDTLLDTIDQRNNLKSRHQLLLLNITYTEPLYKDHFLDVVYSHNQDLASSEKLTYDYNVTRGAYDHLNDSLSNSFQNTARLQNASLSFRARKTKYDYSIGVLMQRSSLNNNNATEHNRLLKTTTVFFPLAIFNYAFSNNHRLRLRYTGNTLQPDVTLLQPVPNNNNPLYIQLGNPDLKPSTVHNITVNYNTMDPITFRNAIISAYLSITRNKIIMASWLDSIGRQVSQPLNVNGAYSMGLNMSNAFPLKKTRTNINTLTRLGLFHNTNYTNGQSGAVNNWYAGQTVTFNYFYKQFLDCSLAADINYNGARYSQQKESNLDLYTYTVSFNANVTLPLGFIITGNMNYQRNAGITAANSMDIILVNANIAKSILPHKQGLIKLQGFDLLNKNQAYMRTTGVNYVEDVQDKTLGRFFLLSFTYFLNP